jgi:hypothetical protein
VESVSGRLLPLPKTVPSVTKMDETYPYCCDASTADAWRVACRVTNGITVY